MKKQLYVIVDSDGHYYGGFYSGRLQFVNKKNALKFSFDEAQGRVYEIESLGKPCHVIEAE